MRGGNSREVGSAWSTMQRCLVTAKMDRESVDFVLDSGLEGTNH